MFHLPGFDLTPQGRFALAKTPQGLIAQAQMPLERMPQERRMFPK
jgi:hypothetical protein